MFRKKEQKINPEKEELKRQKDNKPVIVLMGVALLLVTYLSFSEKKKSLK